MSRVLVVSRGLALTASGWHARSLPCVHLRHCQHGAPVARKPPSAANESSTSSRHRRGRKQSVFQPLTKQPKPVLKDAETFYAPPPYSFPCTEPSLSRSTWRTKLDDIHQDAAQPCASRFAQCRPPAAHAQRGAAARVRAPRRMHQCRIRVRAETALAGYFKTTRHAATATPEQLDAVRRCRRDARTARRRRRAARIATRLTRPRKRRSPSRRSTRTAASWSTPSSTPTAL